VKLGLFCATPSVPLSRNVSRKRAFEMLVTGDDIDADTARDYGLVNRVVDHDQVQKAPTPHGGSHSLAPCNALAVSPSARSAQDPSTFSLPPAGALSLGVVF
jgi:enoyl-CoA hydratase/carnithine racemase